MEEFNITIGTGENAQTFHVQDFPAHKNGRCKFEVFKDDKMVLSLKPDGEYLDLCENPGELDHELIHLIINRIEALNI